MDVFSRKESNQISMSQMTLRDFFAGMALAGIIQRKGGAPSEETYEQAYRNAEGMLALRAKLHAGEEPTGEDIAKRQDALNKGMAELFGQRRR